MDNLVANDIPSLLDMCSEWYHVGSRVTCDPPVTDTDIDILCLVEASGLKRFLLFAAVGGFELAGSVPASELDVSIEKSRFVSLRLGDMNLIVTADPEFAKRFMVATWIAKQLNLRVKADRIDLFQFILYANGRLVKR